MLKKHQIVLSFLPIIGAFSYLLPIFFKSISKWNFQRWNRAGFSFMLGMLGSMGIFGCFAIIVSITHMNLETFAWLFILMGYLSLCLLNVIFFLAFNKFDKPY